MRTRRVVMDGFIVVGGGWIGADRSRCFPVRRRCEVLQAVLLVELGLRESRPYAWSRRNCVQVGPTRRGAGPRPPRRSTVAMVVADTSIPSFTEFASDPEVAPPWVLPSQPKGPAP